jgi:phosphate starvation-inducible protein PhoH
MGELKKDIQFVIRNLKALTKKAEVMARKLDRLEKAAEKKTKPKPKAKAKAKVKTVKRAVAKKVVGKKAKKVTATDKVLAIINKSKKGVNTATLMQKTGFNEIKVRNIVFRLKNQKKITSKPKGIYVKM